MANLNYCNLWKIYILAGGYMFLNGICGPQDNLENVCETLLLIKRAEIVHRDSSYECRLSLIAHTKGSYEVAKAR